MTGVLSSFVFHPGREDRQQRVPGSFWASWTESANKDLFHDAKGLEDVVEVGMLQQLVDAMGRAGSEHMGSLAVSA